MTGLFHTMSFRDAREGMAFLKALGFVQKAVYASEQDPDQVVHAQYDWPSGGGIMFGSAAADSTTVGTARCYCVTATEADVDRIHEIALASGGRSVRAPVDMDYGGRGCTVADPEGNQFSFGSYPGE